MKTFSLHTRSRTEFIDITSQVAEYVRETGCREGLCCVYIPHTTAAVTINENADPSVCRDVLKELNKVIPFDDDYDHTEGNSAAHAKSTLVGCSVTIPVQDSRLLVGTWQGIYFCEFDGPRTRSVIVAVR